MSWHKFPYPENHTWYQNADWTAANQVDRFWADIGLSAGRGIEASLKKFFYKPIIGVLKSLNSNALKYLAVIGAPAFITSKVIGFTASLVDNKLTGSINKEIKNQYGLDAIQDFSIPIEIESDQLSKINELFDLYVLFPVDPNRGRWQDVFLFKRIMERLYEIHGAVDRLDFNLDKTTQTSYICVVMLHVLYCWRGKSSVLMSETQDSFSPSIFADDDFANLCMAYTKYGRDNTPEAREIYRNIGLTIAGLNFTATAEEVATFNDAINNSIETGEEKLNKTGLLIAAAAAIKFLAFS